MRVCIVGAGAIGGCIGTRLAAAGHAQVSAVARGSTLAALREHGWRMRTADGALLQAPAQAGDAAAELGAQDLVIIAVKGPALAGVAASIAPLLGDQTVVMPAMNGVPWWFVEPGLESVDPGGTVAAAIALRRVVGCVVHISTSTPEPGFVQHTMGNGLIVGEPAGGGSSARVGRVVDLLAASGFDATQSADIRRDVWYKLWGNLTTNPVTAITGATVDLVLADPLVCALCSDAMLEARAIGARIGCPIDQTPEDRHAITARLGAFRTSMLQDVDAGRPIELDAIVGAVHEIGLRVGVAAPNIAALLGLTRLFGRVRGLYPPAGATTRPVTGSLGSV